jgi:hypothetical protein
MNNDLPEPPDKSLKAEKICFGLNRRTDEESLKILVKKFAGSELLETLVPRLTDAEITAALDFLSSLMHKHLSKREYHHLFLN